MNIYKVARLKEKKHRKESGHFLVEGDKAVSEAVAMHRKQTPHGGEWNVVHVYATESFLGTHGDVLVAKKIPFSRVDSGELAKAGSMEVQGGAIAILQIPGSEKGRTPHMLEKNDTDDAIVSSITLSAAPHVVLALDGIKDPGNLGTIIRTADWFGVSTILLGTDTVDVYNPKCIAATMGSFLRVRCMQVELTEVLPKVKARGVRVYTTALRGTALNTANITAPCVIVMGSESHGVKPKLCARATEVLTIPKYGAAESLNVGVATGILLNAVRAPRTP